MRDGWCCYDKYKVDREEEIREGLGDVEDVRCGGSDLQGEECEDTLDVYDSDEDYC